MSMKKLLSRLLGKDGEAPIENDPGFVWVCADDQAFCIRAPQGWEREQRANVLSISSPSGGVAITLSAYTQEGGQLADFAATRFVGVQDFYVQQGAERQLPSGLLREYEGTWPGEDTPTYYAVAAVKAGEGFFSVTVVTSRRQFEQHRDTYLRIMQSVRLGGPPH
jgi:hypothetical protein